MIIRPQAVFNIAETTAFFQGADGMRITEQCYELLAHEGIEEIVDLTDFTDEMFDKVDRNLKKPIGNMPNPNANQEGEPAEIPIPPVSMSAYSLDFAKKAAHALRYYGTIGRPVNAQNMSTENVIFIYDALDALKTRAKETKADPPLYDPRTIEILRHQELLMQYFEMTMGSRNIPLSANIRKDWNPNEPAPPLLPNRPYSVFYGSVRAELVNRATLDHPKYDDDNGRIFDILETVYASSTIAATSASKRFAS